MRWLWTAEKLESAVEQPDTIHFLVLIKSEENDGSGPGKTRLENALCPELMLLYLTWTILRIPTLDCWTKLR
jgi:hypothetical protein